MNKLIARTVLKDTLWIIERNGKKAASLQFSDTGYTLIGTNKKGKPQRQQFKDRKSLLSLYDIEFTDVKQIKGETKNEIHGYPCKGKPYNDLFDVKRRLPVYTKTKKSKSFYCAGYYLVKIKDWKTEYCPKLLMLSRNDFIGPFRTKEEAKDEQKRFLESTKESTEIV